MKPRKKTHKTPHGVIHLGDCLEILTGMETNSVDAMVTDPPYCSGGFTEAEKGRAKYQGLMSNTMSAGKFDWFEGDNMTTQGLVWLLRSVAVQASRVVKEEGSFCCFCDWRMALNLAPALESAGFRLRNLVVWDKGSPGLGTGFRPQHEIIIHLTKRGPEFHSKMVGNVIRTPRTMHHKKVRLHPTEKPIDLVTKLVEVVAPEGGVIVDPFLGSGTTAVACMYRGRRYIGIEKDPKIFETAKTRIIERMSEL